MFFAGAVLSFSPERASFVAPAPSEIHARFHRWRFEHGKNYSTAHAEATALAAFASNDNIIASHNAKGCELS